MMTERDDFVVQPLEGYVPEIGRAVWMLEDARQRTLEWISKVPPRLIDWQPPQSGNSIGTLLYHIAAIEADWLYAEVLTSEFPDEVKRDFSYEVRDANGKLTAVTGLTLSEHLARLERTRDRLLAVYRTLMLEDFRQPRKLVRYDVTPEWVLHHLMQHEAEHRGEIGMVRLLAEHATGTNR